MRCSKTIYIADVIVPYTATHLITRADRFISRIQQDLTSAVTFRSLKPASGRACLAAHSGRTLDHTKKTVQGGRFITQALNLSVAIDITIKSYESIQEHVKLCYNDVGIKYRHLLLKVLALSPLICHFPPIVFVSHLSVSRRNYVLALALL